ncbi:MAG: CoA pyrophosphatase [Actinomycetota bacterium]|nr:CoA pyrophosphatase [Actinomycetota bacterium]
MRTSDALRERLRSSLHPARGSAAPGPGRPAAVLVPLVEGEEPEVIFTRRTADLRRHPGEISFPGGMHDAGDGDLLATALREAEEELGLSPHAVEVLGALEPISTYTTGFWVTAFVGALEEAPTLTPNPDEIAEVFRVPVRVLDEVEAEVEWTREGQTWRGFVYEVDGHVIWGATGRMLHEFLEVYRMWDQKDRQESP